MAVKRAVILANEVQTVSIGEQPTPLPLVEVFGIPLVKRAVLTGKRAGLTAFTIVLPPGDRRVVDALQPDRRLAGLHIDYVSSQDGQSAEGLRALQAKLREPFLLMSASVIYEAPRLENLRQEGASSPSAVSPDGRLAWIDARDQFWLKIETAQDVESVEEAMFLRGGKPSDGIYAKFNKQVVGRPLIYWFMRTPITANMISLFGLALAILSGVAFGMGGYVNSLLGAALAYVSSIMDHCDGVVARLKHLESRLGTWLETVCDYASYMGLFGGLSIGLYRHTGHSRYLYAGASLVVCVILGFLSTGYQRKKYSGDRPQDFVLKWHEKVEADRANPVSWFSRNVYFVTRRASVPYWVLGFTLLNLTDVFLWLCVIGANLFVILSLYSNRLFKRPAPRLTPKGEGRP
jgi:phosphatidylglycerophosphate synthase